MEVRYQNYALPLPLIPLRKNLRKKHSKMWPLIDRLVEDYVKSNGDGFRKMNSLILKLMEAEIDLYMVTQNDLDELNKEIKRLDDKFKTVYSVIEELNPSEIMQLWIENYENNIRLLNRAKSEVLESLKSKEFWSPVDSLFLSYYTLYVSVLEKLVEELVSSKIDDFKKIGTMVGMFAAVYGSVIVGYMNNDLKPEVLINRLSEMSTYAQAGYIKSSRKVEHALSKIDMLTPTPR